MAENTQIEWADHTFNPWIGCSKISLACDHCYAETLATARLGVEWGPHAERRRTAPSTWKQPQAWNRKAEKAGVQYKVFCASLADVFDNAVDTLWRDDLANLIVETPNLIWLLLTKRIGNAAGMLADMFPMGAPSNVWIGATIANQEEADRDIPKLLATPAAKRFLSMEPLLGPVDLTPEADDTYQLLSEWYGPNGFDETGSQPRLTRRVGWFPRIDWVITGGESGPKARPSHPDWFRSLRDQCAAAGVPFLFKQWGEWEPRDEWAPYLRLPMVAIKADGSEVPHDIAPQDVGGWRMARVGKKAAGRLLDGIQHDGMPA